MDPATGGVVTWRMDRQAQHAHFHAPDRSAALLDALEAAFFFLALLFVTNALTPLLNPVGAAHGVDLEDSNPRNMMMTAGVFALSGLFLLRSRAPILPMLRQWPLLAAIALPLISTFWSVLPDVTFRRAGAHALTVLFCLYVAACYTPERFLRFLFRAIAFGAGASVFVCLAAPQIGVVSGPVNAGAWIGVYNDKIISGGYAALGVLLALIAPTRNFTDGAIRWLGLLFCTILLVQSQSRTGFLMIGIGIAAMLAIRILTWRRLAVEIKAIVAAAGALFVVGAAAIAPLVLELMGRDATMSGRTKLWNAAIEIAHERNPFLGSGFRVFWTETGGAKVKTYIEYWGRLPGNGHNGYLDTWLEMGWLGAGLLALLLLSLLVALAIRMFRDPERWAWRGLAIAVLAFIVNNYAFTLAFKHSNAFWATCLIAFLYAAQAAQPRGARLPAVAWRRPARAAGDPAQAGHGRSGS